MSGKFSQPRDHREEERQIEETFRKVTGPGSRRSRLDGGKIEYTPKPKEEETQLLPELPDFPDLSDLPEISALLEEPVNPSPASQKLAAPPAPKPEAPASRRIPSFIQPEEPMEEDVPDQEAAEPDLVDKLMDRWDNLLEQVGKNRKVVLIVLCALSLAMVCGFMGVLVGSFSDPYDRKILDNVTILDVQVGGMTQKEAIAAVTKVADNLFAQPMVIDLSGNQITLNAKDTRVTFNVKAAVAAAYDYGRAGTNAENEQAYLASRNFTYAVPITAAMLEVNDKYIHDTLSAYAQEAGATLTQTAYGLEGAQPELSADKFNENAPAQTLVITMGTPGIGFDVNDVTRQVVESYRNLQFLVEVENVEVTKDPDPIDLRAIWEELHIDPVEASVDPKTNQTTPGAYGYTFDLEAAQKLLEEAQFGDVLRIPMEYVAPEILDASAFFRDILGEHQTRHTGDNARNTNLTLACQAIHGNVIEPGATFSFNTVTGQRTSARGYKTAYGDTTDYATEFVGGGVSQVSSTLYYAALLAEMEITARTPGTYAPGFIDFGMDAEVTGTRDFAFRNPHSYPVRIEAQVTGGYVRIQLLGTEEREHYVMVEQTVAQTFKPETTFEDFTEVNPEGYLDGDVVEEGITGYSVKTYKVRYDRQTNRQLTRDFIATTNYRSENRIVAKIEVPETTEATVPPTTLPPVTTAPTTVPTTPTTAPTTQPPTTQPPTTQPPTTQPPTVTTTPPETQPPVVSEPPASEGGESQQQESQAA